MRTTDFTKFLYVVKRYGYKDFPFDDIIFDKLSGEMGVDHSKFDNERGEDKDNYVCQVFKSSFIF
jgi:hypothetical protein